MTIQYTTKTFLLIATFFLSNILCYAQLNKVCPVSSKIYDKHAIKGMNLLLNTKDCAPYLVKNGKTTRTASVQLVNASQPFPPLWFQMGNQETDTTGFFETTFLFNIRIQDNGGHLTFFNSSPGKFYGSVSFDTATLQLTDTLKTYATAPKNDVFILDSHDYQTDSKGNKLIANHVLSTIDARCLSGLQKDSARKAFINEIIILNPKDSIIFRWNPFDHLSPCEMNWAYEKSSISFGDVINWSHINSLRFTDDGNIIYSYRHVGLVKINRTTGEIMWKLGGKDSLNSIQLPEEDRYYLQHDFMQRKDGLYSVFSNGDDNHPYIDAIVYKINDKNKTVSAISHYIPNPKIFSKAMGSYYCDGDTCILAYGAYNPDTTQKIPEMARILVGKKIVATLHVPGLNFPYKVLPTKWAAIQRRPKIVLKKDILYSDSKNGLHDYTWYKIDSTTALPIGTGLTFTPLISGKYVVEAQQGTGLFKSYLVSDVIDFRKKK